MQDSYWSISFYIHNLSALSSLFLNETKQGQEELVDLNILLSEMLREICKRDMGFTPISFRVLSYPFWPWKYQYEKKQFKIEKKICILKLLTHRSYRWNLNQNMKLHTKPLCNIRTWMWKKFRAIKFLTQSTNNVTANTFSRER